jgi:hypothetical protein
MSLLPVDRDWSPAIMEALFFRVDWPLPPREGEGVEILEDFESQTVGSGSGSDGGSLLVHLGRIVHDNLQVKLVRRPAAGGGGAGRHAR